MPDDPMESKSVSGLQDPRVERFRPRPDGLSQPRLSLVGFLADSDKPGHRRLYFSISLDYYGEFKIDDVLTATSIPPERGPFPGMEATEVTLRKDAVLSYTRTRRARPPDEFDIDLRRTPRPMPRRGYRRAPLRAATDWGTCGQECGSHAGTCETCGEETCDTCDQETCHGATCEATYCCAPTEGEYTCPFNTCQCTLEQECHNPSVNETACETCSPPGCH